MFWFLGHSQYMEEKRKKPLKIYVMAGQDPNPTKRGIDHEKLAAKEAALFFLSLQVQ